jgi:histidine phosphotransferase ChpT
MSAMSVDTRLMEMLCTRLCHDITGPVGAIANGAELLEENDPEMKEQAMQLIVSSGQEAINRLQFYRMAYGKINARGEASMEEISKLAQAFFQSGKVKLEWQNEMLNEAAVVVSREMARLLLNLLIISAGTLIRGGVISIRIVTDKEYCRLTVSASGMMIKWEKEIQDALQLKVSTEALDPHTIQAYYTGSLAKEAGAELKLRHDSEVFECEIIQPVLTLAECANQ